MPLRPLRPASLARLARPLALALFLLSMAALPARAAAPEARPAAVTTLDAGAVERLQFAPNGVAAGDQFGSAVAGKGDFNGDGIPDLVVGAPLNSTLAANAGRAYVYFGGPRMHATPDVTLTGSGLAGDEFGFSVAFAGDVNGDGYDDIVVGAPYSNVWAFHAGAFYLFYGGAVPDGNYDLISGAPNANDLSGWCVAGVGDLNQDGYAEWAVGVPFADAGGTDTGSIYLFWGSPSGSYYSNGFACPTPTTADQYGTCIAPIGDVDYDGYPDFAVGAPYSTGYFATPAAGRVFAYRGGRIFTVTLRDTIRSLTANQHFGSSIAGYVDPNGNNYMIVGAPNDNGNGVGAGAAYYVGLPFSGFGAVLRGEAAGDAFGSAVANAGDLDHDGNADLLISAPAASSGPYANIGRAYVFSSVSTPMHTFTGSTTNDRLGNALAALGDLNGDGFPDIAIGEARYDGTGTDAGRTLVYDYNRYQLAAPNGGQTWNVGSLQDVTWAGSTGADISLSPDGGATWSLLETGVGGRALNTVKVRVPHLPTRFARIRVKPTTPSVTGLDRSDSLFTITTSVALLSLRAQPRPGGGVDLAWASSPPVAEDGIAGYRLYRARAGEAESRVGPDLLTETAFADPDGDAGARYRLAAVNGLGEESALGETTVGATGGAPLAVGPVPFRSGSLTVSFTIGSGAGRAEVGVFDLGGREVKRLASGALAAGPHALAWDGRDDGGQRVPPGLYFVKVRDGARTTVRRIAIAP